MPGIRLLYSAGNPAERRKACMELSRSRLLPTLTTDKTYGQDILFSDEKPELGLRVSGLPR